jgi:hypothetical protein
LQRGPLDPYEGARVLCWWSILLPAGGRFGWPQLGRMDIGLEPDTNHVLNGSLGQQA